MAQQKAEEVQTKDNESRQLEDELRKANDRVNLSFYLFPINLFLSSGTSSSTKRQ
jgi:hypothetical protein